MGGGAGEKAKDFQGAMKRLFKELKAFKILISIALILAILGSVLSIIAPNKLSELTDKISEGLVVNKDNLETLTKNITVNLNEETIQEKVTEIMTSKEITMEDKQTFQTTMGKMQTITNENESIKYLLELPESIQNVLFTEFEMDGTKISSSDQIQFLSIMSTVGENLVAEELYAKIDEMPTSIQEVVKPFMDIESIKKIALFLAVLYITSALFTYIQSLAMTDVANKFAKTLRSRISVKINQLPLKYFDRNSIGDVLSRVTNDIDTIAQSMNMSLATLVSSVTLFVGTIIMMFYTNWIMAITAILSSLIGFVLMFLILGKSQKYFVARQVELGKLNGHIEEIYSGLNVVKVYNGRKEADRKFDELNKQVNEANRKSQFLSGLMQPIMYFIGNFGYVAVCIVGAILTMNDMISFGVIVAFITYVRLFTNPLSQIAQAMTQLQSTAAASERVFEFLDEEEMSDQKEITRVLNKQEVKGNIEFQNVVFQYDNNDKPTIKNFSAQAKPGQKVAIVGPTRCRKNNNGKFTYEILRNKFWRYKNRWCIY